MSKQVRFFALAEDLAELELAMKMKNQFAVIADCVSSPKIEHVDFVAPKIGFGDIKLHSCLVRTGGLPTVSFRHVSAQAYWFVDDMSSAVISFSRCHFDGRLLREGRLFLKTGTYVGEKWNSREQSYLDWADSIFRVVKRTFARDRLLDSYVGRHAQTWRSKGGLFVGATGGS